MYIPMQYSKVSGVNIYQQIPLKLSTEFSLAYTNTFFSDSSEDKSQVNICVNYACKVIPKMFLLKSKICQPVFNLFMKQVTLLLRVDNGMV